MLAGIGAGGQSAFDGGLGEQGGIGNHGLHSSLHGLYGIGQVANFVLGLDVEPEGKVALAHFVGAIHQLGSGCGDAAGNDPGRQQGEHRRHHAQNGQQARGIGRFFFGSSTGLFDQLVLQVAKVEHRLVVGALAGAQFALQQGSKVGLFGVGLDQFKGLVLRHQIGRAGALDLGQ